MPTRRRLLQTGLATIAMPTVLRAQGLSGQITLMSYSGIFQDNYTKAVVEPFLAANPGLKVNYAPGGTSAQMVGSVRAQKADPQIDVVIMDVTTSSIGNIEGLFEKLTPAEFPVLEELAPEARAAGGEFGPAVTFDHLVLVYDTQNLKPPIAKLADLWRPDLKGQLALSAPPNIQGLALTAMVEKMEGGDHRKSIDAAMRKLKELAPSVNTFEPNPDGYSLILNGVVKVATGWNARSQLYGDQSNGRIGTLLPPEGSVFQINTINLTAGSKNRAVAAAFVKHALSQPAQKAFTERMFYAPTNAKAQIDPKAVARTAAAPESRASMIPVDWNDILKVRDQWNNRWRREVISAAR
ncbi:extracellular solute-binding protein [Bosea sp. (in: a-proteobacteria)]|uniref:extracellular solute-binding protein n=1 Tax=Bosea sp. (in: a-proteobacteria) TaxID=1871050 RepID=UPI002B4698FA|nr:extracellular solute-binding protein [Bosea sp. (in: a-proteobacteria)]WRH60381.1 MAG: extracellular solute-binding protein [Bosea sp. (in: a-proteobacteria)]